MDKANSYLNNHYAVIIGINRYRDESIPELKYARADAEAVFSVFTDPDLWGIPAKNIKLLLDEQATLDNIRLAIGSALRQKAEMVYIYFAGHGSLTGEYSQNEEEITEKYLVPVDAEYDDLPVTALSVKEIAEFLEWKEARQVAFILDCSFNGFEGGRTFENLLFPVEFDLTDNYLEELTGEGIAVIAACEGNELAIEADNWKHGLFTVFLLEGLQGKAFADNDDHVLLDDLYEFVYANVTHYAELSDGNMHPVCSGKLTGDVLIKKKPPEPHDQSQAWKNRVDKLYEMAKRSFEKGDLDTVERILHSILEIVPDDPKIKKVLATIEKRRAAEQQKATPGKSRQAPGVEAPSAGEIPQERRRETDAAHEPAPVMVEEPPEKFFVPPSRETDEAFVKEKPAGRRKEAPDEKPPKRPPRRRFFLVIAALFFTALFIMVYTPHLNRHENTLLFESWDKSARPLRATPAKFSVDQVKEMLGQQNFYERHWNSSGAGYNNHFEKGKDGSVVIDFTGILMWQRAGSEFPLRFDRARAYIERLNREQFAGYSDWRLPTLEEAMSLVENDKQNEDLNIAPVFDPRQRTIWTGDDESETRKWTVAFYDGNCYPNDVRYGSYYVRAVR